MSTTAWKTDNYKFVGKAFDFRYANRLNALAPILGTRVTNSIDYELEGSGGYGELEAYDGTNLNQGDMNRGFKMIVTPQEYAKSIPVRYKEAKVDKSGTCRKVGVRLGDSAAMTVYMHALRTLAGAFSGALGGDGKRWAATDHPVASKGSNGRTFVPDPDAGTYSNLITAELSVAAITDAQSKANRFITPDALPFLCRMDTLLVSPELEATAKKICGENSKLYPDQVGNVNPVQSELSYLVIGGGDAGFSAKQWAICDKTLMKDIFNLVYITKPTVIQSEQDNPLIDMYTAYVDFALGWGDARQIIFSNPA